MTTDDDPIAPLRPPDPRLHRHRFNLEVMENGRMVMVCRCGKVAGIPGWS
jgi:hypothetical protein